MEGNIKYATLCVVALFVSFTVGRFSAPVSKKTETQTTQTDTKTDKKSEDDKVHKHENTTVVDVTKPDGTKTKTTTRTVDYENDKKTTDNSTDSRSNTTRAYTETIRSAGRLTISALAGGKISFSTPNVALDYGAMVSRDLIGPISIGVFGFKSGVCGVALGLSF